MEPTRIAESSPAHREIAEQAFELSQRAAAFRARLPNGLVEPLADLVRSMNCYYSNLIEGHNTHPVDIERAIHNDLSEDPTKRDLQLEAKAHISVQRWIDEGGLDGKELTVDGLFEIHRKFVELLPDELLWAVNPETGEREKVLPGQQRRVDVKVGLHVAVSPAAIERFMRRFEQVYARLGKLERVTAAGSAHHRLLWIHPFADGNGRVTRLMSYATLRGALDPGGLWSVSRGLARQVDLYKRHLARCDLNRRHDHDDHDGRGHLSEEALIEFNKFFLEVCHDQVGFMENLMRPEAVRDRILAWAEEEIRTKKLPPLAPRVLDAILFRGSLPRSDVAGIVGQSVRSARNIMTALSAEGIVYAAGPRADWQIGFPARLAPRLMPGLFP